MQQLRNLNYTSTEIVFFKKDIIDLYCFNELFKNINDVNFFFLSHESVFVNKFYLAF